MPSQKQAAGTPTPQFDALLRGIEDLPRIDGDKALREFARRMEQTYMESRFDDITRTGSGMIWDALQKLSPWSESNDMPWEYEILCGLSLAQQQHDDMATRLRSLEGRNEELGKALKLAHELANDAPELNMQNYDENQVSMLNQFMIAIHKTLAAALTP